MEKRKSKEQEQEMGEGGEKKLPYPKSVFFIIGNEFCERFSYYGMKSILSLYLSKKLKFSEDVATIIYHTFSMFCYFTPIFGSILADTILGKFKTIVYISVIYVLGHLLKTLAAVPTLHVPPVEFSLIGLALIAIGTGGIKPCVAAFGGDQFKLPEQTRQLQTFFSVFYFAINAGSLISTILTPAIREDVECFGEDTCYSLAFGVPAILMAVATVIIIVGRPLYVMKPPQGNVLFRVIGCIGRALKKKFVKGESMDHWLDLSKDKYDHQLVEDTKAALRVFVIFIPLPVFWALFDQTGSRWTFQATRMNGVLGSITIKPDQMQVINPILVLILIPLYDRVIYPVFAKFGMLKKPLQKMTTGGFLTAASFVISGFLELEMAKTYETIPGLGESHLHLMNNLPCDVHLLITNQTGFVQNEEMGPLSNLVLKGLPANATFTVDMKVPETKCLTNIPLTVSQAKVELTAMGGKVTPILLGVDGSEVKPWKVENYDEPKKDSGGNSRVKVIYALDSFETNVTLKGDKNYIFNMTHDSSEPFVVGGTHYSSMDIGEYELFLNDTSLGPIFLAQGGVYSLVIAKDPENDDNIYKAQLLTLSQPNSIHIFWLIPQYIVITMSEIMISITGLEFSYSQAPESMKSVLQAGWLLTVAFGNIIVIIVASAKAFDQASEFFMFAALMCCDMFLFMGLAYWYTPREQEEKSQGLPMDSKSGVANNNFQNDTEM